MSQDSTRQALLIAWDWLQTAERFHPDPTHPPTQPQTLNLIQLALGQVEQALDLLSDPQQKEGEE